MKRKLLLAGFCLVAALGAANAQNKSMGVGTPTPNTNASLHVESPTLNQGFIMPRLTTAQRNAMASLLTATDNGLMLYDTDLSGIYIWDGTKWKSTAEVAGGAKLGYPYKDSVVTATGTNDLFKLSYNNAEPKRVVRIENLNAANGSSSLSVLQMGTGLSGYFQVNNPANGGTALYGTTNSNLGGSLAPVGVYGESSGTGSLAGSFRNTNASNGFSALWVEQNGTGPSLSVNVPNASNTSPALVINHAGSGPAINADGTIQATAFVGDGSGLTNLPPITFPFGVTQAENTTSLFSVNNSGDSAAISGTNTGAGNAGLFSINNPTNPSTVVELTTNATGAGLAVLHNGSGPGSTGGYFENGPSTQGAVIFAHQAGSGRAGQFQIVNPSSTSAALRAYTDGLSNAGFFTVNNASNTLPGIFTTTNGTGAAIAAENTGAGNGFAGLFNNTNAANTYPAIQARTSGTGTGVRVIQDTGTGGGIDVYMQNAVSAATGLSVNQQGIGMAASFSINNASSTQTSLFASTNGSGGQALSTNSTGNARAAYFALNNASASSPAVTVTTNGLSNSLEAFHTGTGAAFYAQAASGDAGRFEINNVTATGSGIHVTTNSNQSMSYAVKAIHSGTGDVAGFFQVSNAGSNFPAIYGQQDGTGPALYGNAAGSGPGQVIYTNAGTGIEIQAASSALALDMLSGGLKYAVVTPAGLSVTNRAGLFNITNATGPGTYTFYTPTDGETCIVYNNSGGSITINPGNVSIATSGTARQLIAIGGVWIGL